MTYFQTRRIENFTISTGRTGVQLKPAQAHHRRPDGKAHNAAHVPEVDHAPADSTLAILSSAAFAQQVAAEVSTSSKRCSGAVDAASVAVAAVMSKLSSSCHWKK